MTGILAVTGLIAATLFTGGSVELQAPDHVVVNSYPHDTGAFTQGLDFHRGRLYETTGQRGSSTLRRVDLETGEVRKQIGISDRFFGEGMTAIRDRLWWITWQEQRAFLYDPDTFERRRAVRYRGEGWGLTHNGRRLIMSNGTAELVFRHPRTFEVTRRVRVTENGNEVADLRLNELEWVEGEVFANAWPGNMVARIDPSNGNIVDWIDLSSLKAMEQEGDVTNGIAYMNKSDRLFVTGKNWSRVYEIELAT